MKKKSYLLRDIPESFWRQIKSTAALKGVSIQKFIVSLIEKELKIKPVLSKRAK